MPQADLPTQAAIHGGERVRIAASAAMRISIAPKPTRPAVGWALPTLPNRLLTRIRSARSGSSRGECGSGLFNLPDRPIGSAPQLIGLLQVSFAAFEIV